MTSPFAARAERLTDRSLKITFKFRREVVDAIKIQIPADCRAYDPIEKAWIIHPIWANGAVGILRSYFDVVDMIEPPSPTLIRESDRNFATLHLLPSAPAFLVDTVYKALARQHHPDAGGDPERMKAVNLAYEAIRSGKRGAA